MTLTVPIECVVDASIGIKLVVAEPDSAQVHALFDHLVRDAETRFVVPQLFFTECANVLKTLVRRKILKHSECTNKFGFLDGLPLQRVETPVDIALGLALAFDVSVYDAIYVATSAAFAIPLITADDKLARALRAVPIWFIR